MTENYDNANNVAMIIAMSYFNNYPNFSNYYRNLLLKLYKKEMLVKDVSQFEEYKISELSDDQIKYIIKSLDSIKLSEDEKCALKYYVLKYCQYIDNLISLIRRKFF